MSSVLDIEIDDWVKESPVTVIYLCSQCGYWFYADDKNRVWHRQDLVK